MTDQNKVQWLGAYSKRSAQDNSVRETLINRLSRAQLVRV
jgi:hypothetical protein